MQTPSTEINRVELLTEPNQELQLDSAGPIKSKTSGDVHILVALDRFSKWPTAHICKNTDTRTVKLFFKQNFAQIIEHHGPFAPITTVVLKAKNSRNFAPPKT